MSPARGRPPASGKPRSGAGKPRSGPGKPRPGPGKARSAPGKVRPGRRPPPRPPRSPVPERSRVAAQRALGGEQVEGRHAVRELLIAGRRRVRDLWMVEDAGDAPILGDILELATEAGLRVRRVGAAALAAEARSEAPQGVLAHADPLPEADFDELLSSRGAVAPFLVFLDGVTDPQNLGALLRSAEGAGATGVVLPRHRAAHVTPTVAKAAAGAIEHLSLAVVGGLPAALAQATKAGVWVVGLDSAGDTSLFELPVAPEPVGLVLGAEGRGLSRLVRQRCDVVASIPLKGALSSLNVASAGALACFEISRRR